MAHFHPFQVFDIAKKSPGALDFLYPHGYSAHSRTSEHCHHPFDPAHAGKLTLSEILPLCYCPTATPIPRIKGFLFPWNVI
jgi:hypothetical protein